MNVSAEEKSPGQQQQPPVDAPGNDPIENLGKKEENETKDQIAAKAVNSEQNGGENKTKESKEDDSANDKDKKGTEQGTGVDTAKEEPSEEDLKSMPVRQYLETTGMGLSVNQVYFFAIILEPY